MKIGLALGSGSSRGWAHIGVIQALMDEGIEIDIVCGTSIGSLVGAAYASGNLNKLETAVRTLNRLETARFLEINTSLTGFVNKDRLQQFLESYVVSNESTIENLDKQFSVVATELDTGREIWLAKGSVIDAIWASISLPGLFPAIAHNNKWLIDGGLVNPVPVSVCRALGADIVIAVNLNGDLLSKHAQKIDHNTDIAPQDTGVVSKLTDLVSEYTTSVFSSDKTNKQAPSVFESISSAINIAQDRITRSRMAGDPPDIMLSPKLGHIGLLEFYRAEEAILEGRQCVERMLPEIQHVLQAMHAE